MQKAISKLTIKEVVDEIRSTTAITSTITS